MSYKGERYVNEMASGKEWEKHKDKIKSSFSTHGKKVTDALKRIIMNGTRSGRMYTYNGRRIRASAPGEPPANRSGRLANSNDFVARRQELAIFNTAFANGAPYPSFLEEGTSKMEARAWFEKTIIRLEPLLYQSLLGVKI
jgi:hypothetical protein